MTYARLHDLVAGASLLEIALFVGVGFSAIYLVYAGLSLIATRRVLPALGIGALIESRPIPPGQVLVEIRRSLTSIAIFAGYGVLTVYADRAGWIAIVWAPSAGRVVLDLVALTLWNEVHFYACHRLLHTRWLYRHVHSVHHRSVIPTPFSTFSFHWVEATMLSSVMFLLMLVWPLSITAVIVFPMLSLVANSIGHMNYAVFPNKHHSELFAACQRHTRHHTRVSGNYGFYLPWLDRWLGTRAPARDGDPI